MYHEHQSLYKCGVHAVNNLLGESCFNGADFERFAEELTPGSWWNPHKAVLGLGNYDVNVLEYALLKRDVAIEWHDNRRPFRHAELVEPCLGLVLNQTPSGWLGLVMRTRHWVSVRHVEGTWWNCDSMKRKEEEILDIDDFVQNIIDHDGYCLIARHDGERKDD